MATSIAVRWSGDSPENHAKIAGKSHASVYDIVTERILSELEKGEVPWRKPWRTLPPANLVSKKHYRGINFFLLSLAGYGSQYWLTYRQAQALGGNVRKGEHGTKIVFWKFDKYETETPDGETEKRKSAFLRYYVVFNLEQTEGLKALLALPPAHPIELAEAIVAGMPNPPAFEQDFRASYIPSKDTVTMPSRTAFPSQAEYYSTLFHELTHSTGHAKRLGREGFDKPQMFGSESYSREELIAEMGSEMLCGVAGIEQGTVANSLAYLQAWTARLKGDSRLVVSAASVAQKAADHIRGESAKDSPAVSGDSQRLPQQRPRLPDAARSRADGPVMPTRVAVYARVSTINHGQDVSMQTRELRQFAEARGWTIAGEYIDAGVSGAKDSRPELNRLMAYAKRRTFDVVLVWKLDRFGRSLKHLVAALGEFEALGIAFVSLRDSFDLTTPAGRLMFNVIASFAEFERDLIRERVKAGSANRRAKGFRVGRKPISIDPTRLEILRSEGRTIREIAVALGCSRSLVHKTLSERTG